jgi:hypothetical protein
MRFTHIRGISGGNVTVAFEHDQEKDAEGPKTITAAFAFCSPLDNFNKAKGRQIAEGRFNSGKTNTVELVDVSELPESRGTIAESVLNFLVIDTNPMKLAMEQRFDDDLVAPRWIQVSMMQELAQQLMSQQFASGEGCCEEEGCDCE